MFPITVLPGRSRGTRNWCVLIALLVGAAGCEHDAVAPAAKVDPWTREGPVCGDIVEARYRPADRASHKDFALVHDGERFHVFATRPRGGWLEGGAKDFAHASSTDLVDWTDHPLPDLRRPMVAEDHVWAPHVIRHAGQWWMFYTGVSHEFGAEEHNLQRIVSVVSDDLESWTPTSTVIEGDPSFTSWGSGEPWSGDCRDPMIWREGETWILLATVRLLDGRQCIARAQSTDLLEWSWIGPLLFTAGPVAESPTAVRYRERLWLFWTSSGRVKAASAPDFDGPFSPEEFSLIGYANESLALADGSVLLPRIRANAVTFTRMLRDEVSPPLLTSLVSPTCFEGTLLLPDPTVKMED